MTVYIHALREEGDVGIHGVSSASPIFLSTPSARRATEPLDYSAVVDRLFLSTPSARRATRLVDGRDLFRRISIHALREEGDVRCSGSNPESHRNFYPRPPRGGRRTPALSSWPNKKYFYPRPPRGGRHLTIRQGLAGHTNFYPRPPRGGRRMCRWARSWPT